MDRALTRAYIDVIGKMTVRGETFATKAMEFRRELLDRYTDIDERLAWVDEEPADSFEDLLRRRARAAAGRPLA